VTVELCARGFAVVGIGRRIEALQATADLAGAHFTAVPLDVADGRAVVSAFQQIAAQNGPIAILINNAAVYPHRDTLDETPELFAETVAINLCGIQACSHAALQDMVPRGRGRILNVSTFADLHPIPMSSAYSVSKGAARILTRAMIADLGDRFPGIILSDWMPGVLKTDMGLADGLDPAMVARWGVNLAQKGGTDWTGSLFEMGHEIMPPRGLKSRIKSKLTGSGPKPRTL
jgi:NAD(P)-dependent dehydrogenase (short-subunit alcohol dehydrogenase family)